MRSNQLYISILGISLLSILPLPPLQAQQISSLDRGRVVTMLDNVAKDVQRYYYDPKFHGIDWKATVRATKEKNKSASSLNMALANIAQAMINLNDSHTFFLPPTRPFVNDYGYQSMIIGEKCYIIRVRPGSDAEAKGVRPGDEVAALEGYPPDRANFWKMEYRFNTLRPEPHLRLVLRDLQGQQRQVDVKARFEQHERVREVTGNGIQGLLRGDEMDKSHLRPRWTEASGGLMILKLPVFMLDQSGVDRVVGIARKHQSVILDLRGDPGGVVDCLRFLLGGMFDKDIKIADRVGRKESEPEVANSLGQGAFTGKLIVLIDSRSASCSELFARIVQLEKRGIVLGDRSSGSVMEARRYRYSQGAGTKIFYGAEITESDLIMSDGKSLEHVGVTPDEIILPTPADLAAGRDPVLARAATLLGVHLTTEMAGRMFPYEWPKDPSSLAP